MSPAKNAKARRLPPRLAETLSQPTLPRDDLHDEGLLSGLAFDGTEMPGRNARLVDVEGCRLRVYLSGSRLEKVTVKDSVFETCDLANVSFASSSFTRVELRGCRATGLAIPGGLFRHVLIRDCTAQMSAFRFASLTNVEFVDCRLSRADFVGADLTSARFRRCDLTDVDLSQVKARGALFVDCVWQGVRGVSDLAGATVVHGSPLDAEAFLVAVAGALRITLGDPEDYAEDDV